MTTIALDPKEGFFIAELYPAAQDLLPIANPAWILSPISQPTAIRREA